MTDVEFIYAEELGMGPDAEKQGIASAEQQIDALFAVEAA